MSGNLDGHAGLRIPANPRFSLRNGIGSKSDDGHFQALLERSPNAPNQRIESFFRLGFSNARFLSNFCNEITLVQGVPLSVQVIMDFFRKRPCNSTVATCESSEILDSRRKPAPAFIRSIRASMPIGVLVFSFPPDLRITADSGNPNVKGPRMRQARIDPFIMLM